MSIKEDFLIFWVVLSMLAYFAVTFVPLNKASHHKMPLTVDHRKLLEIELASQ